MSGALEDKIRRAMRVISQKLSRRPTELFLTGQPWAPPDQGVNSDLIALACGLLSVAEDLQGFVLDESLLRRCDLQSRYGINPHPLFQLNSNAIGLKSAVRRVLSEAHGRLENCFPELLADLRHILEQRLLGAGTPGKMAFVRDILHEPLTKLSIDEVCSRLEIIRKLDDSLRIVELRALAQQLIELRYSILDLLERQWHRLPATHGQRISIERIRLQIRQHVSLHDLLAFGLQSLGTDDPRLAIGNDAFCESYSDQIVQLITQLEVESTNRLSDPSWRCIRGRGIETAYVPRTARFLRLGDEYGDCTARRTAKQIDRGIPNIHWTVYSWLLDPFYRVIEIHVDGEATLKAHLLPLILEDEPILALDAVEVLPKIRDTVRRMEHNESVDRQNKHLSRGLFERRQEMIDELFCTVIDIGRRMNVNRIFVDKYSNARWVREVVDRLPEEHYHISSIQKPFGLEPLNYLCDRWLGQRIDHPVTEIQAGNLLLMDQGLRPGYKSAGVLFGSARSSGVPVRGP